MKAAGDDTEVGVDVGVERLLRLLWLFRRAGQVRTNDEIEACGYPDLHAEGSAGRKNFFNDRERLKELGVALEQIVGRPTWRVSGALDDARLILTPEERDALTEARLLVAEEEGADSDSTSVGRNRAASQGVPSAVPLILAAISDRNPVRFVYGGRSRYIDPYRVAVTPTDRWYLLGIDRDLASTTAAAAVATRTFRIDRITDIAGDREAAVPACPPDATWPLHPVAWGGNETLVATVRFPHEPLPEWLAMLGQPSPESENDGDDDAAVTRDFPVTNREAFVRRVLAVGATITGPPALVDLARVTLDAHMRAYGTL